MVHSRNPNTSKVEARGSQVPREPQLYNEFQSLCLRVLYKEFEASMSYMKFCLKEQMLFYFFYILNSYSKAIDRKR